MENPFNIGVVLPVDSHDEYPYATVDGAKRGLDGARER